MSAVPYYLQAPPSMAPAYTGPLARPPEEAFSLRDFMAGSAPASPAAPPVSPSWAIAASVFGQLAGAYANFAAVRMAKLETKAQASTFGHRARMLELDRRAAARRAESLLEQGASEIANVTLEGGQRRAAIEASTAARGVEAGVGSAAEVQASEKLIQDIDVYNINLARVKAANAARAGAVAAANEGRFARASGINLRRSARAAAPESQLFAGIGNAALSAYTLSNYRRA